MQNRIADQITKFAGSMLFVYIHVAWFGLWIGLVKDLLLQAFPETFAAPGRFAEHMMIVADLENGNADAIEDALIGAWELQSGK